MNMDKSGYQEWKFSLPPYILSLAFVLFLHQGMSSYIAQASFKFMIPLPWLPLRSW